MFPWGRIQGNFMFDDASICYWLLWLCNSMWFWVLFLLGLTVLAFWPIIINKVEEKADRIKAFKIKYIERNLFTGR